MVALLLPVLIVIMLFELDALENFLFPRRAALDARDKVEGDAVRRPLARRLSRTGPAPGETLLQPPERQPVPFPHH